MSGKRRKGKGKAPEAGQGDVKKVVARNRRATHDYEIIDRLEAGMALLGPEVKSLRNGQASLSEAYAAIRRSELYLCEMHIPEYTHQGYAPHEPNRPRKLLVHRREMAKLEIATTRKGFTLVPLQVYFRRGRAKVELGVARGRKRHDKRDAVKSEEARREARAAEGRRRELR